MKYKCEMCCDTGCVVDQSIKLSDVDIWSDVLVDCPFCVKLTKFQAWRRWFRFGKCRLCGKWTLWILRSEDAHEECWLDTK